jgi:uroporphyrinogen decarboxylase
MLDLQSKFAEVYLGEVGAYIRVIWLGDDSCTQKGPYVSPEMYRELVKPHT